jgi:hypothetical protein
MKSWITLAACAAFLVGVAGVARAGESRIGAGANYWVTVDNLDKNVDDNGFSYLATYQNRGELLGLELDAEFFPDRFGQDAWAPEAYFLIGKAIYAGAGIGIMNTDGDFADDPFYALKAGLDLEVLPSIHLDISANYRFNDKAEFDNGDTNIDTDTIFLGAAVRLAM